MEETEKCQRLYALIGKNIGYSQSLGYFNSFFKENGIKDSMYVNFDTDSLEYLPEFIEEHKNLRGFNVTIPYKEEILKYIDRLDEHSGNIEAVNVVKVDRGLYGYNTDFYGFGKSIKRSVGDRKKALILGTGGASKAVAYSFLKMGVDFKFVSRNKKEGVITYDEIDRSVISDYEIIVNCTPLGSQNRIEECPDIPYEYIGSFHLLYDLIYTPSETVFLKKGRERGAVTLNGKDMLIYQAEASYKIWEGEGVDLSFF